MTPRFFIGTSGWNYRHWKRDFYPEKLTQKEWLSFYAREFSTVEVNNTFYRWPDGSILKKWRQQAPESFLYTLKAPRTFTHVHKLKDTERQLHDFLQLADTLQSHLGCLLFQFPASFRHTETNREKLSHFLRQIPKKHKAVLEFRHPQWWRQESVSFCQKHGTIFCSVSGPDLPDEIVTTANTGYMRFHGLDDSFDYSPQKLSAYARKLKQTDVDEFYLYFNNDQFGNAPRNAKQMISYLSD